MKSIRAVLTIALISMLAAPVVGQVSSKKDASRQSAEDESSPRVRQYRTLLQKVETEEARESIRRYFRLDGLADSRAGRESHVTPEGGPRSAKTSTLATVMPLPNLADDRWYTHSSSLEGSGGGIFVFYYEEGKEDFETFETVETAKVRYASTSDNGSTWTQPATAIESEFAYGVWSPRAAISTAGRILVAAMGDQWPNIVLARSDDDGGTWTPGSIFNGGEALDLKATPAGGFAITYKRDGTYRMRKSADGVSWGSESTIASAASSYDIFDLTIAPVTSAEYVAVFVQVEFEPEFSVHLRQTLSTNSGASWGAPVRIASDPQPSTPPALAHDPAGTTWLLYSTEEDIHYEMSADGGRTWSQPGRWTRYAGFDGWPSISVSGGSPLAVFGADRNFPNQRLWVAHLTQGADSNPDYLPPVIFPTSFPFPGIAPSVPITVTFEARDETGVAGVEVAYSINESPQSPIAATNTGGDEWAAELPLLELGDTVEYGGIATDTDGNAKAMDPISTDVIPFHNVGNLSMAVPGGWIPGIEWPAGSGDDYLWSGSFMVGATVGSRGRFIDIWEPDPGVTPTSGPGESDQDIVVGVREAEWLGPQDIVGVRFKQRSYQWMSGSAKSGLPDGVAIEYEITNTGANGDLADLYTGLYLDADILGGAFEDDLIGYDPSRGLLYMYDSGDICSSEPEIACPTGYIGAVVISNPTAAAAAKGEQPFTANWPDWNLDLFDILTSGINADLSAGVPLDPADYQMVLTAQPFALASGATGTVAFGIVMGGSLGELVANADALEAAYQANVVAVEDLADGSLPTDYALEQNYPNPFNPSTQIAFSLPRAGFVELTVYDVLGKAVQTLVSEDRPAGSYDVTWDASGLASGMYFYRLSAGEEFAATKSLVLLK